MEKVLGDGDGEEVSEYESDPEEAKMSLKMRRREASDDEDGDVEDDDDDEKRVAISDDDDDQGGAAEYDDDDDVDDEEEYYDEQDEFEEEEEEKVVDEVVVEGGESRDLAVRGGDGGGERGDGGEGEGEGVEKKENEPFAVPTSGAFYMHDDRFRENNAGGRHRRTFGGRKLWESKDDRKWGHDKFEEMNLEDRHYEEGRRSSRGSFRGRGKTRGTDRGYGRGGRMRGYGGNTNQGAQPKDVRGRGPKRYQPSMKNRNETHSQHYKQSGKSMDKIPHPGSGRATSTTSSLSVEHEQVHTKKVASNLNSASPPFYPSGSSNKDISLTQKKEVQASNHNRNNHPSNNMTRGKNVIESMGVDNLHSDDSMKPLNNAHMLPSGQIRAQGRGGVPSGSAIFQPQANNQSTKVSSSTGQPSQRVPGQSRGQSSQQVPGQQIIQRPIGGSQTTSPPKGGLPVNTFEPGNYEGSLEPGKSKVAVGGKGKGSVQGTGRGALVYGGAQVMGSGGNGDPNLPAFFPVMQFGGQHPGGIPAVGMAFPGYVAQPNGIGNSEMTWLPVLSGALGASYCPPYLAVDGSYNPRPPGQTSALPAPSKDNNQSKPSSEHKPQQRSDLVNDEFSQRQNKPRRYSEMNFSQ